jgi:hypothetical protein
MIRLDLYSSFQVIPDVRRVFFYACSKHCYHTVVFMLLVFVLSGVPSIYIPDYCYFNSFLLRYCTCILV